MGLRYWDALWKWRVAGFKSQTLITAVNAGRESRKRENVDCVATKGSEQRRELGRDESQTVEEEVMRSRDKRQGFTESI
jgi:hypothetical protein